MRCPIFYFVFLTLFFFRIHPTFTPKNKADQGSGNEKTDESNKASSDCKNIRMRRLPGHSDRQIRGSRSIRSNNQRTPCCDITKRHCHGRGSGRLVKPHISTGSRQSWSRAGRRRRLSILIRVLWSLTGGRRRRRRGCRRCGVMSLGQKILTVRRDASDFRIRQIRNPCTNICRCTQCHRHLLSRGRSRGNGDFTPLELEESFAGDDDRLLGGNSRTNLLRWLPHSQSQYRDDRSNHCNCTCCSCS